MLKYLEYTFNKFKDDVVLGCLVIAYMLYLAYEYFNSLDVEFETCYYINLTLLMLLYFGPIFAIYLGASIYYKDLNWNTLGYEVINFDRVKLFFRKVLFIFGINFQLCFGFIWFGNMIQMIVGYQDIYLPLLLNEFMISYLSLCFWSVLALGLYLLSDSLIISVALPCLLALFEPYLYLYINYLKYCLPRFHLFNLYRMIFIDIEVGKYSLILMDYGSCNYLISIIYLMGLTILMMIISIYIIRRKEYKA